MPYVSIQASKELSNEQMNTIQREIGRIVALIPGKNIDNCLTNIQGGCNLYIKGESANAAFVQIRMLGVAPKDAKEAFTKEIGDLLKRELDAQTIYINFMEYQEWGTGGGYKNL